MSEIERIVDQLERAHLGRAWHGPSLMELLADVDEARARARPLEGAHTIEELVLHVIAWQNEGVRRLDGEARSLPVEEDWPAAAAWSDILLSLRSSFDRLVARVCRLSDAELDATVAGESERHTVYRLLHGIVQHNLYHAGQVALLKKRGV